MQRAAQTVLGVYLKRLLKTSGILNDYALYKSTHSLTQGSPLEAVIALNISSED